MISLKDVAIDEMSRDFKRRLLLRELGRAKPDGFRRLVNAERLSQIALSKHRNVKVVGSGSISSVAIDPLEWRYILAGTSDGLVAIYDCQNPSNSGTLKHAAQVVGLTSSQTPSRSYVSAVQWHPSDNGLFISSGADGQLRVWDANELTQPVETFLLSKRIYCHHISPGNPSSVAVATDSNHIRLLDLRAGSSTHELRGHAGSVSSVLWAPRSSSILASGCHAGKVLLWDVRKARNCLMSFDMGNLRGKANRRAVEASIAHKGSVNGLAFSCTARHIVSYGAYDGRLRKWDVLDGTNCKTAFEVLPKVNNKLHVPLVTSEDATSLEEEAIFVPTRSNILVVRFDGTRISRLTGHFRSVTSLSFSKTHLELISGSTDRAVLIWDCNRSGESAFDDFLEEEEKGNLRASGEKQRSRINTALTQDAWSSDEDI